MKLLDVQGMNKSFDQEFGAVSIWNGKTISSIT